MGGKRCRGCPKGAGGYLMRPEALPRLRQRARGEVKAVVERWAKRVAGRIGDMLPADETAAKRALEPRADGGRVKVEHVARAHATKIAGGMDLLCALYLATGEANYRDEIKRRGLAAAAADLDGVTAHDWQHVIKSMTLGALALHDESPEARAWFEWGFKAHVAFYPWFGGADGGSAEGLGYYRGHNLRPSMEAAALFEAATGVSLFDHPWYRNTGYFLLYGAGLGAANSQVADGNGQKPLSAADRAAVAFLAGRFNDRHLAAYYQALGGAAAGEPIEGEGAGDPVLTLLWKPKLPTPAPQTFDWLLHAKNRMEVIGDVVQVRSGVAAGRL